MKSVAVHAVLAIAGLLAAYQTWTREEEEDDAGEEVVVVACSESELQGATVDAPRYANTIVRRTVDGSPSYWISHQRKPKKPKRADARPTAKSGAASSDAAVGDAGAPVPSDQASAVGDAGAGPGASTNADESPELPEPELFVTNDKFDEYLKSLSPVRAHRSLGRLSPEREAEFGFDEVDTHLSIDCAGKHLEFEVGGRTYGTGKRYIRRRDTGDVYLVAGALVQDLQSARFKFRQTDLHAFELADVEQAVVSAAGLSRTLVHRERSARGGGHWVDSEEPDKRNELYGNWFARVAKLRVNTYLGADQGPGDDLDAEAGAVGSPEPAVEVAYQLAEGKAAAPGKLELVVVSQGSATHYYARSETTINWVKVFNSAARQVADDARLVVGAEQPEERPDDAPPEPGPQPGAGPHGGARGPHGPMPGPHGGLPGHGGMPPGHP